MIDPKPLAGEDAGIARLMDSLRGDGPSDAQMEKMLSLANEVAALPRSHTSWLARASVRVGLAIVGVALVGVVLSTAMSKSDTSSVTPATPKASVEAPASTPAVEPAVAEVASMRVEDLPPANVDKPLGATIHRPASSAEARNAGTFAEELALTSAARAALGRGDTEVCLNVVGRYRERFPQGAFAQEIDVIRIEALAKSGARDSAKASAERFLKFNESSPYADRVRSVLSTLHD